MIQIKIEDIKTVEDVKEFFTNNKLNLKWQFNPYNYSKPVKQLQSFYCKETKYEIIFNGIGNEKIKVNDTWITYKGIYDAIHRDYHKNSLTINSILCLLVEGYKYKHFTEKDVQSVIFNRENSQYLLKRECPKYIPLSYFKRACNFLELPFLSKIY